MQVALAAIRDAQGGVCVVADGKVVAMVALPIAGLLSDKRVAWSPRKPGPEGDLDRGRLHDPLPRASTSSRSPLFRRSASPIRDSSSCPR